MQIMSNFETVPMAIDNSLMWRRYQSKRSSSLYLPEGLPEDRQDQIVESLHYPFGNKIGSGYQSKVYGSGDLAVKVFRPVPMVFRHGNVEGLKIAVSVAKALEDGWPIDDDWTLRSVSYWGGIISRYKARWAMDLVDGVTLADALHQPTAIHLPNEIGYSMHSHFCQALKANDISPSTYSQDFYLENYMVPSAALTQEPVVERNIYRVDVGLSRLGYAR